MIRLVVNADDLGLHPRIDEGIFQAAKEGIVTSTSVLATGRTAKAAAAQAKARGLGLGVHLALTSHLTPAAPASEVRWLAPGSRLRKNWSELATAWLAGLIPPAEVAREFRAQVERVKSFGVEPDHLDTHQHLHLLPGLTGIVEELAAELNLPVRWPLERPHRRWLRSPKRAAKAALLGTLARIKPAGGVKRVRAHGVFESGVLDQQALVRFLDRLNDGEHELMCHPGLAPDHVPEEPGWRYGWELELDALRAPAVREVVTRRAIELTTYAKLA